jgi:hypothetical protein
MRKITECRKIFLSRSVYRLRLVAFRLERNILLI